MLVLAQHSQCVYSVFLVNKVSVSVGTLTHVYVLRQAHIDRPRGFVPIVSG